MLHFGLFVFYLCLAAAMADEAWKTKRVADWTAQDTKEILTNSPWAVMNTPTVKKEDKKRRPIGIGIPGVGRHQTNPDPTQDPANIPPAADFGLTLNIRWESALPVREAELKAREINAPVVEENLYGIAVYGLPSSFAKDPKGEADRFKGQAVIKREGQKDLKPSHVDVIQRDDGVVVVYLFPRTKEITASDKRIEFDAQIGAYQIAQPFNVDQMMYQGKLEL